MSTNGANKGGGGALRPLTLTTPCLDRGSWACCPLPPRGPKGHQGSKGLGPRHDGGREASFTAAVAEAATTVAISRPPTPEGCRGRQDLGVPCHLLACRLA